MNERINKRSYGKVVGRTVAARCDSVNRPPLINSLILFIIYAPSFNLFNYFIIKNELISISITESKKKPEK